MIFKLLRSLKNKVQSNRNHRSINIVAEYENPVFINGKCSFTANTHIGSNCHFNGIEIGGHGEVFIGDNFQSGEGCLIITDNHNYDSGNALPYDDTFIVKNVSIGKNVWIGSRVIILGGAIIGDGAVIQAGSVVVGEIPSLAVCGGHPATIIKYRDAEHYYKLEEKGKYC